MSGVLVRFAGKSQALAWRGADVVSHHRRTRAGGAGTSGHEPLVSKVSPAPLTNSRPAAQHAISVPALPEGTWAAHLVHRVSARERLHPAAVRSADCRSPKERADRQLLELWRPDRSREERGMRPLRLAAVDARHEAGQRARRRAARSRSTGPADRSDAGAAAGTRTPRGRSVIRRLRAHQHTTSKFNGSRSCRRTPGIR